MFSVLLAAGLILAADTVQPDADPAAGEAPPQATSALATSEDQTTQVEGVKVERTCRFVEVTGARSRRRVCSDDPISGGAAGVGGLGTVNKSQQSNINSAPRR